MELTSSLQALPWYQDLRAGQKKIVDLFERKEAVVAQLPTGYGKTRAAAGGYVVLKKRGRANRCLYTVPRSVQAQQAAEDFPREVAAATGEAVKSFILGESQTSAWRAHRKNEAEIFIATIQSLVSSPRTQEALAEMMQTGQWFLVVDEYHHYGNSDDNTWTQRANALPRTALLAMSATPDRPDGPSPFGKPDVAVTYLEAWREGAVKALTLHAYEYRVDAVTVNGDVIPFNTRDLFSEAGSDSPQDVDRWMASRQMRWSPKYVSPLIHHPTERILGLRTQGIRAQMLVQAISCSHAKTVCEQVSALVPPGMRVDWVGTGPNGRSDADNGRILREFCPPKDRTGLRPWTLDVLVNVGMAGEGLDCVNVCEIVFLTSPNRTNSALQSIGRGARTMPGVGQQPTCTVNTDGASELAEYVGKKIMEVFDDGKLDVKEREPPEERERSDDYEPLPDTLSVAILDVNLTDIRTDPVFQRLVAEIVPEVPEATPEKVERLVEDKYRRIMSERDARFNQSAIEAQTRNGVDAAVGKVASLIMRRATTQRGLRPDKSFIGDLFKRINSQKKRALGQSVKDASVEQLEQHYRWVKQLEARVLSGEIPEWLR
jgi:Type III restriction enzyme, res subunit